MRYRPKVLRQASACHAGYSRLTTIAYISGQFLWGRAEKATPREPRRARILGCYPIKSEPNGNGSFRPFECSD